MIKVSCGHVTVLGPEIIIGAELATLFHHFAESDTFTKKRLHQIVDDGFLTEEELNDRIEKEKKKNGIIDEQEESDMQMIGALVDLMKIFDD